MKKTLSLLLMVIVVIGLVANPVFSSVPSIGGTTSNIDREEMILHYDGDNDSSIGTGGAATFTVAARYTPTELAQFEGATFERVQFYVAAGATTVTIKIFDAGTATIPGTVLVTQAVPNVVLDDWNDITLTTPITVNSSNDLWVGYEIVAASGYPAGCDAGPVVAGKGAKIQFDGTWQDLTDLAPTLTGNWNIRAVVQTVAYNHDLKIQTILEPNGWVDYATDVIPTVQLRNVGLNDDSTSLTLTIEDNEGIEVYNQTLDNLTLVAGASQDVAMPNFTASANSYYNVNAVITPAVDDNMTNNTASTVFNTLTTDKIKVIMEKGTGTWCQYCPGAAMGAEDLIDNGHDVAVIAYHNGDTYVNADGTARLNYYNITSFPTTVFDGIEVVSGGSNTQSLYPSFAPVVDERAALKTAFNMMYSGASDGTTVTVNIDVEKLAPYPGTSVALHFAITESGIAENWQGQTEVNYALRDMVPSATGTALTFTGGDVQSVPLSFTIPATWVTENLECVAFVQDNTTKEILQGINFTIAELNGEVMYPPQNLVGTLTGSSVALTWDAPQDGTPVGYVVYKNGDLLNPTTDLFFNDILADYGTYNYNVTAMYATGESASSNTVEINYANATESDWLEDFESYLDYSIAFDPWTLVDVDGLPTYGLTGTDWTNAYAAQAYIIFNPANTTPATTSADAYAGAKYAACFNSVPAAGVYNNDWMISPILNLGSTPDVSFMVKSFTADYGLERFVVAVSTGSTDPNDFTPISTGSFLEAPIDWAQITLGLTDYANQSVRIAIQCVSQDAFFLMVDNFAVTRLSTTDTDDNYQPNLNVTTLTGNYPNPFNPETTISFNLKNSEHVSLDIFNVKGQKIATVVNDQLGAGTHNIVWSGTDLNNKNVASGIYFYKLQAGTYTKTKKMILMK